MTRLGEHIEAGDPWPAFSAAIHEENDASRTLRGEQPPSVVGSQTKALLAEPLDDLAERFDGRGETRPVPEQILPVDELDR